MWKVGTIFRWFGVLVAAAAIYIVAYLLILLFFNQVGTDPLGSYALSTSGAIWFAAMLGSLLAPGHQRKIGLLLITGLIVAGMLALFVSDLWMGRLSFSNFVDIGATLGGAASVYILRDMHGRRINRVAGEK